MSSWLFGSSIEKPTLAQRAQKQILKYRAELKTHIDTVYPSFQTAAENFIDNSSRKFGHAYNTFDTSCINNDPSTYTQGTKFLHDIEIIRSELVERLSSYLEKEGIQINKDNEDSTKLILVWGDPVEETEKTVVQQPVEETEKTIVQQPVEEEEEKKNISNEKVEEETSPLKKNESIEKIQDTSTNEQKSKKIIRQVVPIIVKPTSSLDNHPTKSFLPVKTVPYTTSRRKITTIY